MNPNNLAPEVRSQIILQLLKEFENIIFTYKLELSTPTFTLSESSTSLGSWQPNIRLITISTYLITNHPWKTVTEVLKHEIAHQIADEIYGGHIGHDQTFMKACEKIAVESWARSASVELNPTAPNLTAIAAGEKDENPFTRKLGKLLNLAKSANENEATLALTKAKELREKYNLQDLKPISETDIYVHTIRTGRKRLNQTYTYLVKIITSHFGVKAIFSCEYNYQHDQEFKSIEIIGTAKDIVIADYIFSFLRRSVDNLWTQYKLSLKTSSIRHQNSYKLGVLVGFEKKLNDNKKTNQKRSLVKHDNLQKITTYLQKRYPKTVTSKSQLSSTDQSSFTAGTIAGKRVEISSALSTGKSLNYLA